MSMALKLLFLQVVVLVNCDGRSAVQESCQQATANDEISMLQGLPAKRGAESVLVAEAEAEAKAKDLDPEAESALVAVAEAEAAVQVVLLDPTARVETVIGRAEVPHSGLAMEPLLIRVIEFYKSSLETWPHLTNGMVAYFITTMGDASAQIIQGGVKCSMEGFDIKRNVALALTASMYSGLILTSWLLAINKALPGFGLRLVMGKLAATQTLLQPFVYVPFFFIVHGMFCGQSFTEIRNRIRSDYFDLLFRLWALFMPSRFLMFLIIPVRYQVLWDSSIAFIWQFALSLMIAKKGQAVPAQMISGKKGGPSVLVKAKALMPGAVEGLKDDAPTIQQ